VGKNVKYGVKVNAEMFFYGKCFSKHLFVEHLKKVLRSGEIMLHISGGRECNVDSSSSIHGLRRLHGYA
jgi:hypothetical protein